MLPGTPARKTRPAINTPPLVGGTDNRGKASCECLESRRVSVIGGSARRVILGIILRYGFADEGVMAGLFISMRAPFQLLNCSLHFALLQAGS
jgi:hypothetical protein